MFHLLKKNAKKRHHLNQGITYQSCFRCFPDFFRLLRCFPWHPQIHPGIQFPNVPRSWWVWHTRSILLNHLLPIMVHPVVPHRGYGVGVGNLRLVGFLGWVFWGTSGCNKMFNGKNLVTKNMNMTNMTVMTLFHQFCWILLWFLMISAVSSCTHCCKFESSLTNLKAFAFRPVRSNAVSLH